MVEKAASLLAISSEREGARREAARAYAAYFAGAPVHSELEMAERRLLEVLTSLYRKK